eukprot:Lithocolla_globosa_v1_NODE_362_length_4309_cov_16.610576.p3 type:complete len:162 gc:universal NODE_362_length_4309_cov_16.610576:2311-1826(-)
MMDEDDDNDVSRGEQFVDKDPSIESFLPCFEDAVGWHVDACDTSDQALLFYLQCQCLVSSEWRHFYTHVNKHDFTPALGNDHVNLIKATLKLRKEKNNRRRFEARSYPQAPFIGLEVKDMYKCNSSLCPFMASTVIGMRAHLREKHKGLGNWTEAFGQRLG